MQQLLNGIKKLVRSYKLHEWDDTRVQFPTENMPQYRMKIQFHPFQVYITTVKL